MKYYNMGIDEVIEKLQSNSDGLSKNDVDYRLKKYGNNVIKEAKKESMFKKFLNQFKDLMILILCIAAVISFVISFVNKESYVDSISIITIVILNAILGFVQELKADKALDSLKKMQTTKTKVKRNGNIIIVDSCDVVVGDILVLEAGDTVCADARVIYEASLKCDESSLTGESMAVLKTSKKLDGDVPLAMRKNMIYSGTSVVYGKCLAIVTATGMNTEFGLIAKSLNEGEKEITPLEKKINEISKVLSFTIMCIIAVMFVIGLVKGLKITEVIMLSISLAVAAIPEGLPAVITITLSLGVSNMAKNKAVIRKMSSVETLGCTEVICSDKTGTITQNKMTVRKVYFNNKVCDVDKDKIDNNLIEIMALNNDVSKNGDEYIGDPTEIALYHVCENHLVDIDDLRNKFIRVHEVPFDSERKMMSTVHKYESCYKIFTKGSFDSIIKCCSRIYENGNIIDLDLKKKKQLKKVEAKLSGDAYRILAFAFKELPSSYDSDTDLENDLIFIGMSCMIDPPRTDVKEAIECCKKANIKPIMITGDSIDTAVAISKEIGILTSRDQAITGTDLDKLSKSELKKKVKDYSVYARVSPMNKLDIVSAWQDNHVIVAMTGDGVNDAPALKKADIGVGMGITGTEVSKNVSDVILTDDSFSTIVTAVKEGRRIYDNIRNVLVYLLTGNITEIIIVFIGMLFGFEIFLPIQLLYINLVTDSIPAIALAFEDSADDIMSRKIRKKDSSFFTQFLTARIILPSVLKSLIVLFIYFTSIKIYSVDVASTMAFLSLILFEMLFAISCRNLKNSILRKGLFKNKYLNKSMIGLIIMQLLIFLTPIKHIFNIADLSIIQIAYCIILVLLVFFIDEVTKEIIAKHFKD